MFQRKQDKSESKQKLKKHFSPRKIPEGIPSIKQEQTTTKWNREQDNVLRSKLAWLLEQKNSTDGRDKKHLSECGPKIQEM